MTNLQLAESLFDEAEREERDGDNAALAERNLAAELHYERARVCRKQGIEILDRIIRSQQRQEFPGEFATRRLDWPPFVCFSLN